MNAVILIGLCALGANAQFFPYSAYTPNFLHSGAFTHGVGSPVTYTVPVPIHTPITYAAAPAVPVISQHHAQDELGQFNFGHSGGPSSRHETRDAFGVVRGAFNYIDGDGKVQHQSYVADAGGFRVAATNLPVAPEVPSGADAIYLNPPKPVEDTFEVATAKAEHERLYNEAAAAALAQDELGQFNFGHSGGPSSRPSSRRVAPTNLPVAPEVPSGADAIYLNPPKPVEAVAAALTAPDTPARKKRSVGSVAVHSAVSPLTYGFNAIHPFTGHAVAPAAVAPGTALTYAATYGAGHAFAPALTYAAGHAVAPAAFAPGTALTYATGHAFAPAVTYAAAATPAVTYSAALPAAVSTHDSTLLRVENNPGHAVSYRVY